MGQRVDCMGDSLSTVRHLRPGQGYAAEEEWSRHWRCIPSGYQGLASRYGSSRAAFISALGVAVVHRKWQRKGNVDHHSIHLDERQYSNNACTVVETAADWQTKHGSRPSFRGLFCGSTIWRSGLDHARVQSIPWHWCMAGVQVAEKDVSSRDWALGGHERVVVDGFDFQHTQEEVTQMM